MAGLLNGKVVLVNGGTQGVGAAVARTAVREGAAVVVTGRRTAAGERFVDELADSDVRFFQADLADVDAPAPSAASWSGDAFASRSKQAKAAPSKG